MNQGQISDCGIEPHVLKPVPSDSSNEETDQGEDDRNEDRRDQEVSGW